MIKRSTWIVLAIFAVLLLVAVGFWRFAEQKSAETPTPAVTPTEPPLFSFSTIDVQALAVSDNQGNKMEATQALGNWTLVQPAGQPADGTQIDSALTSLQSATVSRTLSGSDVSEYGLDAPTAVITLTLSSGQHILSVGNPGPSNVYYVQLDGGAPLVVGRYSLGSIIALAATPPVASTPTPELTPTLVLSPTLTLTITPTLVFSPTEGVPFTSTLVPSGEITPTITLTPKP